MQKAMEKDKAIKVSDNESDSEPEEQSGRRVFHSKVCLFFPPLSFYEYN